MSTAKTSSFETIIATLGGVSKTARAIGRKPSQICQWRASHGRFPAAMYFKLCEVLAARGHGCPRDAFRFADEAEADAAADAVSKKAG